MESATILLISLLTEFIHAVCGVLKNFLQIFSTFLPSFVVGFLTSFLLMITIIVYLIYRTVAVDTKTAEAKVKGHRKEVDEGEVKEEEQIDQIELRKTSSYQCGWVLVRGEMEWPPKPISLDEIKALASSSATNQIMPNQPLRIASFLTINDGRLHFYSSEEQRMEILPSIALKMAAISIHPEDLYIEECFHAEFPLLIDVDEGHNYLFIYCPSSSEKEDWFLSVRHSQKTTPSTTSTTTPLSHHYHNSSKRPSIETIFMERLSRYSSLLSGGANSTSANNDSNLDWLNVLVGRIFFQCFRATDLTQSIYLKFERKMTQSPELPKWLGKIEIDRILMGMSAPFLSNARLHSLSGDGNVICSMDLSYPGGFVIGLGTTIIPGNIPMSILGNNSFSSFIGASIGGISGGGANATNNGIAVGIQLRIKSLVGRLLIHIKEPPSDRLWYGFVGEPAMEVDIDIKIVNTSVDWLSTILRGIISDLIIKSIKDMMVLPLMDDIPLPPLMVRDTIVGEPYFSSNPSKRPPPLSSETFPPKDPHPPPPPLQRTPSLPINMQSDIRMDSLQSLQETSSQLTMQPLTSLRRVHGSVRMTTTSPSSSPQQGPVDASASTDTISSSLKWKLINEARMSDLRAEQINNNK